MEVAFPGAEGELRAFLARPAGPGPHPAVVVIHEAFGLTDHIRDVARRLAAEGYVAFAVDLFAGRNRVVCMTRFMAGMATDVYEHLGIRDLRAALDHLALDPGVDRRRLGAIGFCMGGGFAIAWAATDERLKVIAPFYGPVPRRIDPARLCPVVGSYPDRDVTTAGARRLEVPPHDIAIYRGARHSFFDDRKPSRHHPEASADAWRRTLAFFAAHIGGPRATPPRPDRPGVVAAPPLLYLATLALGLGAHQLWPWPGWRLPAVGGALIAAALAVVRWSFATLRRAGTTPSPFEATSALATGGPFRFSRHPVYVAMTAMYLGASLVTGSLWPPLLLPPLLAVMRWGVVLREERYLAWKLGDPYRRYTERVRRWL